MTALPCFVNWQMLITCGFRFNFRADRGRKKKPPFSKQTTTVTFLIHTWICFLINILVPEIFPKSMVADTPPREDNEETGVLLHVDVTG